MLELNQDILEISTATHIFSRSVIEKSIEEY